MKKKLYSFFTLLLIIFSLSAQNFNADSYYNDYEKASGNKQAEIAKKLINYFEKNEYIEDIATSTNKKINHAKVLLGMSAYCVDKGQFERGIEFGLECEKSVSNKWEMANALLSETYGNVCTAYFRLGKYDKAFSYAQKQYDFAEKMKDDKRKSSALNNIAFICMVTNRCNDGEKYIDKAIAIERKRKDNSALAVRLGTKSEILLNEGKIEPAFECINEAIELERKSGDADKLGKRLSQKADVLMALGDFQQARGIYEECINIFTKNGNEMSHAIILKQLGIAEMQLKEYKSSEMHLLEGTELCKKLGAKPLLNNFYMCLHNLFCSTHETSQALYYCEQYVLLYDTLMTEEHQKQLSEFEVKYKTKEKENQLLEQKLKNNQKSEIIVLLSSVLGLAIVLSIIFILLARRRKKRNQELAKLNETKNRLFSIISHDLRNSVFSQKRILDLLNEHFDSFQTAELKTSIFQLKNANDSLNALLIDLLQWASIDGERVTYNPVRTDLKKLVDNTVAAQTEAMRQKGITLTHNLQEETFVNEDLHFTEFILRNLLSNAIKFSHPNGKIHISANDSGKRYTLSVSDYGVGMSQNKLAELFKIGMVSSQGTAGEQGTGLALMICKEMMNRSGGQIWAESTEGKGSTFTFTLNKKSLN